MSPPLLLTIYCLLIVLASLAGGWLPFLVRLTHARMQLMMSFVAGLMLGVGVLHLLPHAIQELQSVEQGMIWMLVGLLLMFFLVRTFHFHHHGPAANSEAAAEESNQAHGPACNRDHARQRGPADAQHRVGGITIHQLSGWGITLGLAIHTLIDGVALAASVAAESHAGASRAMLFGLGTFLAVALHKPLDALSISTLMALGGWSVRFRQLVNAGFALMCPLGALFFYFGLARFGEEQHLLLGSALALTAGVFICISLADLLPELSFQHHDRIKLSGALILGVLLAYGIGLLEPVHSHDQGAAHQHEHSYAASDHPAHEAAHERDASQRAVRGAMCIFWHLDEMFHSRGGSSILRAYAENQSIALDRICELCAP